MFFAAIVSGFLVTFFATPLVIRLAREFKLIDNPKIRKHPAQIHQGSIPRAGGLSLLLGIVIPVLIFLPIDKTVTGILLGCIFTTLVGLWDDRKDLSPYIRFLGNIFTALFVVGAGIGIPFITNPLGGIINLDSWRITFNFFGNHSVLVWADLFAILWIVWTMNIVGWSSGIDGQMPGFVVITAIVLGFMGLKFSAHDLSQTTVATLSFITAGAFLGFLPWNFYPQKIMPGYGGKTLAGFLLSVIAILSGGKVGSALIILAVPMLDATYILIKRIASRKSPFRADKNHLHHKLLSLGWGKRRIALFYWLISAILALVALLFSSRQKLFVFILIAVFLGGMLNWFSLILGKPQNQNE